ncbi:MAG: toprim domain-containing protein, partial [Syntrophorhabdaceae bacterium]|nr:toprim domain-containing protein [Syntrophorhabdaceae bacterium]
MTVQEYLDKKEFEWFRRGDQGVMNCPFCDDNERKFGISLIDGAFNCLHLNKCGVKGSFATLQDKLGDKPQRLSGEDRFIAARKVKKEYVRPQSQLKWLSNDVVQYLYERGFNDDTIEFFCIKSKDDTTLAFPYYKHGELVNMKYRSITDKRRMSMETGAEPVLFNRDQVKDKTRLVITEGEFDCMALQQYGISSVSVPNGASGMTWVENEWEYLESFKEIFICFDNDEAGDAGALALARRVGMEKCRRVRLICKDANECLMTGTTLETMLDCIDGAQDIKPETIVNARHFREDIGKLFALGRELFGIKTPWEKLDGILKGWRPGEVTVWSGKSGAGKSTMLNQVFLDLIKKDNKICIYSGEMPPPRFLRWALIQYCEDGNPEYNVWSAALNDISDSIYVLNIGRIVDTDKMIDDFKYAAKRYGVSHFIIDSLMTISFNGANDKAKYQAQADFVSALTVFAKQLDVHIHLVAHPRKTMYDKDEAGKTDVAGSADITNLCD